MAEQQRNDTRHGDETVTLSPTKTMIPIGIFFSVLAAPLLYIGSLMSTRLDKLEDHLTGLTALIGRVDGKMTLMEVTQGDRWTGSDMRIFIARMQAENPGLKIPPIHDLAGDNR